LSQKFSAAMLEESTSVYGVGYVNLYRQGNTGKAIELAKSALKIDPEFSQVETLPKNLWGDKIIADARKLLSQL